MHITFLSGHFLFVRCPIYGLSPVIWSEDLYQSLNSSSGTHEGSGTFPISAKNPVEVTNHVLIFIPIFGNNKSTGYFLVVWIGRGCKKLSKNLSPWRHKWSDISFYQVCCSLHRFFITGSKEDG